MSKNIKPSKIDLTTNKLAAALDQPGSVEAAKPTPTPAAKVKDGIANKNVVKISKKAAPKKKAVAKKKTPKAKVVAKKAAPKKAIAKKPADKKTVTKKVAAPKKIVTKKPAAKKISAKKTEETNVNKPKKQLTESEIGKVTKEAAEKAYKLNTDAFSQLSSAKNIGEAFEIQSKITKQNMEYSIQNALKFNELFTKSISDAFAAIAKK